MTNQYDYEYAKECIEGVNDAFEVIANKIRYELTTGIQSCVAPTDAQIEDFILGMKDHYNDLFDGKLDESKTIIDEYEAAEMRSFRNDNRTY